MGGASSKTSAEQITNQLMSVMSDTVAKASASYTGANVLNITGNCKFINTRVSQKNYFRVQSEILQNVSGSIDVQQKMDSKVKQISETEAPNINLSKADSETFTKLITNLSTVIRQNVAVGCSQVGTQVNRIDCSGSAEVIDSFIEQDLLGEYLFRCSQKVDSIVKAQQELQIFIDQHSSTKVYDIIVPILIMVALIMCLVIFGPTLAKAVGGASNEMVTYVIIFLLLLSFVFAFIDCVYWKYLCSGNGAISMWTIIVVVILFALSIGYKKFAGSSSSTSV
jgi:hypothetical protein